MTEILNIQLCGFSLKSNIIRRHDFALMEYLIDSKLMSKAKMESVNRCRVFLKVQNLSDVISGDCTHVFPEYLNGRRIFRPNTYN